MHRDETLAQEFARLVAEYRADTNGPTGVEAWNLIADFAVENAAALTAALEVEQPVAEPDYWTSHNNFENMLVMGVTDKKDGVVWDFATQEWVNADVPLYTSQPLSRQGEDNDTIERVSTEAAMDQWERSLKRPDLTEKDRVRGAIEAYKRQAFAFAMLSSTRTASSADGSTTETSDTGGGE